MRTSLQLTQRWCYLPVAALLLASNAMAETDIGRAERAQQAVAARGDAFAQWIDSFFDDPSVGAETADSRLELRQSATFSEQDASAYRVRLSAKLKLPRLSKRLSLTFQGNADDPDFDDAATDVFDTRDEDSFEDPALGLQYIFRKKGGYHGSFFLGSRLDNPSINFGPRFRYQHQLSSHWRGRYTQRILWDTDDKWESRTRFEFDRPLAKGHLLRQSLRAEWRDSRADETGMSYTLKSAFVQRLSENTAISYDVTSRYTTKPRNSWVSHVFNTRFRRSWWRDWVFIEATPFLAFEKEHDWDANPGIRFSIDIIFDDGPRLPVPEAAGDEVAQ